MSRRFSYALAPLLSQRTWHLADLRRQLAALNFRMAEQERHVRAIEDEAEAVRSEWREMAQPSRVLRPEALAGFSAYLVQTEQWLAKAREEEAALQAECEALMAQVIKADRELDAVERHKADARALFRAEQGKLELSQADDHWSILKNRSMHADQV